MTVTSILQFSDIHFGVEDREAMAAVKAYCDTLNPSVVLICGDITQDGKIEEFEAAREWISSFDYPRVITPGNHDTPTLGIFHRIFAPWKRYDRYIKPLSQNVYNDENCIIVPMNTARGVQAKLDWSLGVIDMNELDDIIKTMSATPPETLKFFAVHHPLIYPEVSPLQKETKNGQAAVTRLSDANIDAVLSGHVHAPFLIERAPGDTSLLSIGSGTLSTRMRGVPASFNHILIDSETISVTAINWADGKFSPAQPWIKSRHSLSPTQRIDPVI